MKKRQNGLADDRPDFETRKQYHVAQCVVSRNDVLAYFTWTK